MLRLIKIGAMWFTHIKRNVGQTNVTNERLIFHKEWARPVHHQKQQTNIIFTTVTYFVFSKRKSSGGLTIAIVKIGGVQPSSTPYER